MSATSARAEQAEVEAAGASDDSMIEGAAGSGAEGDLAAPSDDGANPGETPAPIPSGPSPEELGQRLNGAVQALQQARAQARELRQQLAEARQAQGGEPAQGLEIPDPKEDAAGALAALREAHLARQRESQSAEQQRQQAEAHQARISALQEEARMDEAVFRTTQPDYDDALAFLAGTRRNELAILGLSEAEIGQAIGVEALQIIDMALTRGASPARVAYEFAKSRGYRAGGQQAGSALHAIQQGQQAARTLSGAGGRPAGSDAAPEERLSGLNGTALREAWRAIKAERNSA